MNNEELIKQLKESGLYAECTCGGEFKLSDAILFDGTNPRLFPPKALEIQEQLKSELKEREESLKKSKKLATEKVQITTKSVNIGKTVEKILPTLKDFKLELPDCRFLGSPIDLIVFNGLTINKISSISFIEAKTGKAKLNANEKTVKDAIEDKKVSYKEFK